MPQDFVNMGFSPDGVSAERLKASGITDGLSFAFRQLSAGGGPKKIAERVESELRERYGAELTVSSRYREHGLHPELQVDSEPEADSGAVQRAYGGRGNTRG